MRLGLRSWATCAGLAAASVAALAATPATSLAASRPSHRVAVQGDLTAANLPSGSEPFGTTSVNTAETVAFVLKMNAQSQLTAEVEHGMSPSSYLSVGQFASTYGQAPAHIAALESYLAGYGIKTHAYADGLDVVANGTAGEFDAALTESQEDYRVPAVPGHNGRFTFPAQTVHAVSSAPQLPADIAQYVTAILGLTNYTAASTNLVHTPELAAQHELRTGAASSCTDTQSCTAANFASTYNLDPLYAAGAAGQGQTVGIVTLAAYDPGAGQWYWRNVLGLGGNQSARVSVQNIDGGPGAPSDASGSGETDLDVEQSGGVAPAAHVMVYQAPNTDYGFADAFFAAASQNTAASVSTSWGEPDLSVLSFIEAGEESPGYQLAFDEALLEMAAQGQSTFAAAGDSGAYDAAFAGAAANGDMMWTPSTDSPASSPFTTAAGGTTLPWQSSFATPTGATVTTGASTRRTWAWDYLWPLLGDLAGQTVPQVAVGPNGVVGGGGGFSPIETTTPSYQSGVSGAQSFATVPYYTPGPPTVSLGDGLSADTSVQFNSAPQLGSGSGSGRVLPDVSADADPFSGYLLYEPSARSTTHPVAHLQSGWGGTSFVGPQLNGSTAVIDSLLGGRRVGFWNPQVYRFAQSSSSPFTPLDSDGTGNDNLLYTGTPGTVYNPGSGLGYPNLAQLAADFRNAG